MLKRVTITSDHMHQDAGICLECGASRDGCEPDARDYPCDDCGALAVYGIAEAIMMGVPWSDDMDLDDLFDML